MTKKSETSKDAADKLVEGMRTRKISANPVVRCRGRAERREPR